MQSSYKWNLIYWLYANPISALWYFFKKAIASALRRLFEAFSTTEGVDTESIELFAGIFALGILVALGGVIIYGLYRFLKGRSKAKTRRKLFGHEIGDDTDYDHFLNKGAQIAQTGDYAEAIRAEFVGLLLLLERHSAVHILEAWTTTEIGNALVDVDFQPVEQFHRVADYFNRWCYGPVPNVEDYRTWQGSLMPLWREVAHNDK